jgi:hypothetical protein
LINESISVDRQPLIFFHFHNFKKVAPYIYDPNLAYFKVHLPKDILSGIYASYVKTLSMMARLVSPLFRQIIGSEAIMKSQRACSSKYQRRSFFGNTRNKIQAAWHIVNRILLGEYIIIFNGRIK